MSRVRANMQRDGLSEQRSQNLPVVGNWIMLVDQGCETNVWNLIRCGWPSLKSLCTGQHNCNLPMFFYELVKASYVNYISKLGGGKQVVYKQMDGHDVHVCVCVWQRGYVKRTNKPFSKI